MPERNLTDWNSMILGYARIDDYVEVLQLYFLMQGLGILPDKFTFPSVVKACIAMEDCSGFQQVQSLVVKARLNGNSIVGGMLVDAYARFGWMDDAVTALDEIDRKSVVSWNAVIAGYVRILRWEEALGVFHRMQRLSVCPDHFTFTSALRVCGVLTSLERGKQVHAMLITCGSEGDNL
ncbi:hypothetical protein L1049_022556 [Liquidambar formosana]|uniref:Pentatricopeptide repeat-containing protein n=1 Tax=Liquidambar formosana TaxID=63359 RepID=A0AAP0RD51_LIQFO